MCSVSLGSSDLFIFKLTPSTRNSGLSTPLIECAADYHTKFIQKVSEQMSLIQVI